MKSGDKPQTTKDQLMGEPMIVVKEKDWNELRASEARKRALLEKHQWADSDHVHGHRYCPECGECEKGVNEDHAPDCALAAELEGDTEGK